LDDDDDNNMDMPDKNIDIHIEKSDVPQPVLVESFSARGRDYENALYNARGTTLPVYTGWKCAEIQPPARKTTRQIMARATPAPNIKDTAQFKVSYRSPVRPIYPRYQRLRL
jgi:hypothetical protein